MNNCVYNRWVEAGRFHFLLRSGLTQYLHAKKIHWGLSGCSLRFRREIAPFQRFQVTTKLAGWDERSLYLETLFLHPSTGFVHAHGLSSFKLSKREVGRGINILKILNSAIPLDGEAVMVEEEEEEEKWNKWEKIAM